LLVSGESVFGLKPFHSAAAQHQSASPTGAFQSSLFFFSYLRVPPNCSAHESTPNARQLIDSFISSEFIFEMLAIVSDVRSHSNQFWE
jgi:hypothetical protein